MSEREITGKHVLSGFVAAFGLIIVVNMVLAWSAIRTFPGLEVKNSYVASQTFDARRTAQNALGWAINATHSDGRLNLSIIGPDGQPVIVRDLTATVGRATHVFEDTSPVFQFDGSAYVALLDLGGGNWNIRMTAIAQDGTLFEQRVVMHKE